MTIRLLPILGTLCALAGGAVAFGQDRPEAPLRDPTVPVPGSAPVRPVEAAGPDSEPAQPAPSMPALVLRGLVVPKGKPGAAIVEVGGNLLRRVIAGDEFVWTDASGRQVRLRVESLTADEVRLTVPSLAQSVVLR